MIESKDSKTAVLFQPLTVGSLTLKNRVVMAPMTRNMSPGGVPNADVAAYYQRRAEGGVGLILSEGTVIDRPASRNEPNIPFFHGEDSLNGWKAVIDGVHAAGGKMGPQIWHVGSTPGQSGWAPEAETESPSGLSAPDTPRGRAMSEEDIADTISAFAKAAADAKRLGFDMTEVHGAHGYIIDKFFWSGTNTRTDGWGGDTLPERSRFAIEVIKAIRAAVGPGFPISLRVSQWKQQNFQAKLATTPKELEAWVIPLAEAGVDIFHGSQRRFWEPEFPEVDGENGLNFAGWLKKLTGKVCISVGSVGLDADMISAFMGKGSGVSELSNLLLRMEREEFDLIAVGRALLSDPHWVDKVAREAEDELKGFDPRDLARLT
ncbi:MAG: NADH:flavin oxidoreductase [Bacteroidota bacterium]